MLQTCDTAKCVWVRACMHVYIKMYILISFPITQVIGPTDDGKNFDDADAALKLDLGTPRCAPELFTTFTE